MSIKLLDQAQSLVADAMVAGIMRERERLQKLLIDRGVIRIDALGDTVFVHCDTLEVEYLDEALFKGENK